MVRAQQPAEGLRHEVKVEGLDSDTEYKFRTRVVARNGKNGESGPEVAARTTCGSKHLTKISSHSQSLTGPESAPHGVTLTSENFRELRIKWQPAHESTWECADVAWVLEYYNGTVKDEIELPKEKTEHVFDTLPGTKWTVR